MRGSGATVAGRIRLRPRPGVEVPASALTQTDAASGRVGGRSTEPHRTLRDVEVARYDPADMVISTGSKHGELVVTAGAQTLRPGQKVRLLGAAP